MTGLSGEAELAPSSIKTLLIVLGCGGELAIAGPILKPARHMHGRVLRYVGQTRKCF